MRQPLPVTMLLPNRPRSAFTSLLKHPSDLQLTTVQHEEYLAPITWTGQLACKLLLSLKIWHRDKHGRQSVKSHDLVRPILYS